MQYDLIISDLIISEIRSFDTNCKRHTKKNKVNALRISPQSMVSNLAIAQLILIRVTVK